MAKKYVPLYAWTRQAGAHIRHPLDRAAVMQELDGHIEDRIEAYIEAGLPLEEARRKAFAAMGDPHIIGRQLAQVHKPWLSRLYSFSKVWLIVCFLLFFNQFFDTII